MGGKSGYLDIDIIFWKKISNDAIHKVHTFITNQRPTHVKTLEDYASPGTWTLLLHRSLHKK